MVNDADDDGDLPYLEPHVRHGLYALVIFLVLLAFYVVLVYCGFQRIGSVTHDAEPASPAKPTLSQAWHDRDAVVANWPLARELAEKLAKGAPPLLADDLAGAIARGDVAVEAARRAETVEDIEMAVWVVWGSIAHIVNVQPTPAGT